MSNYNEAFLMVLSHEGGFVNDPNDRGGATNMGITQKTLSDYLKKPATEDDIFNLTRSDASKIYFDNYWMKLRLDELTSAKLAAVIFDLSVVKGISGATKELQDALNIKIDGIIGPVTIERCNSLTEAGLEIKLCMTIIQKAEKSFVKICEYNKSQIGFLMGWISRAQSLVNYVLDI